MDDPKAGTPEHQEMGVYRAQRTVALTLPSAPEGRILVVWMCPAEDITGFRKDTEGLWEELQQASRRIRADDAPSNHRVATWTGQALSPPRLA